MNVFSEKSMEQEPDQRPRKGANPRSKKEPIKKISVDPLYESTDKYRRIDIPSDMKELISSHLKA